MFCTPITNFAQAPAEVYTIIDMLQIGQQSEFIDDEPDVPLALATTQRFFDGKIDQQAVDWGEYVAHAKIVFDEDGAATLSAYCRESRGCLDA